MVSMTSGSSSPALLSEHQKVAHAETDVGIVDCDCEKIFDIRPWLHDCIYNTFIDMQKLNIYYPNATADALRGILFL